MQALPARAMLPSMARVVQVSERSTAVLGLGLLACVLASGGGCTTNHDALARQPNSGGSAGGGTGGAAGFGAFGNTGNTGNQAQGGRYNPDYEVPGDNALTIVNGAIDAESVALCFARVTDDGLTSELVGSPLPALPYAGSTVITALDGLSLIDDEIQPWVIAGDLAQLKKLDCATAVERAQAIEAGVTPPEVDVEDAGGAGAGGEGGAGGAAPEPPLVKPVLRARPVAALPAGTVNVGRSILMVLTGCLGGAAYRDKLDASACGPDYGPYEPNLAPIVVTLSRDLRFDKVGLQGLHASPATGVLDLRVYGDRGDTALPFATNVEYGSISPRPADTRFTPIELGVDSSGFGIQALDEAGNVLDQQAWPDLYKASGVGTLEAGRTYTVIALGPDPLLVKRAWWNKSMFTLVDNDPTRKQ